MKALSLRQPWAHFVLHHGKRIENRRWNTAFRGEFLIHAAKGMTVRECDDALDMLDDVCGMQPVFDRSVLQFGGIVGVARLVGVVSPRDASSFARLETIESYYPPGIEWRWHMCEQFGFVLEDVRPMPFIPCRGSLGFFNVPASVDRLCEEVKA